MNVQNSPQVQLPETRDVIQGDQIKEEISDSSILQTKQQLETNKENLVEMSPVKKVGQKANVEEFKINIEQENINEEQAKKKMAMLKAKLDKRESEREKAKTSRKTAPKASPEDDETSKMEKYFRYRVATMTRLIEERVKNNGLLNKVGKGKSTGKTSDQEVNSPDSLNKILREEVWKNLKRFASTKSKYKYRDFLNFEKKVRLALKTLTKSTSKTSANKYNKTTLELDDGYLKAEDAKDRKKSRSPNTRRNDAHKEWEAWKQANPNSTTKYYIVDSMYPDLKKALEKRGWVENTKEGSKLFHFKWILRKSEIDYDALTSFQSVNHFEKNNSITTKVGLARNIRNLIWNVNEDTDLFYPRCYDLNDVQEFDDFIEDFKLGEALAVLRLITSLKKVSAANEEESRLLRWKIFIALAVCERRLQPLNVAVEETLKGNNSLVSQEEWEILAFPDANKLLKDKRFAKLRQDLESQFGDIEKQQEEDLLSKASEMLQKFESVFPQTQMNQGQNVWIVKPAGLSRGRGIRCYDELSELLEHIKVKDCEWVAQKYIENPLIIKNRKFDIRQWVLVTDWNPLTIWFYDECYVRFSAQSFDPSDLENRFAHLTNNSISKKLENCDTSEIEGNMWFLEEFRKYLTETFGTDEFTTKIQPKMKQMVVKSLQSVQDMVETRKNSFELYGYDFMIDENRNPWLIEINSSPTMEYSTTVTEKLVKMVMEDCVKVVIDHGKSKLKNKKNIDTGKFQCISLSES